MVRKYINFKNPLPCLHANNGHFVYEFVSGSGINHPQFTQRYTIIQYDMFSTVTADEFWFLTRWDMHTQMLLVHAQVTAPNKWFSTQTDGLAPKTDGSIPRQMVLRPKQRYYTQTDCSSPNRWFSEDGFFAPKQVLLYSERWFCTQTGASLIRDMVLHPNRCFSTQRDGFTPKQVLLYTDRWFCTLTNGSVPSSSTKQMVLYPDSLLRQMVCTQNIWFCTRTDGLAPKTEVLYPDRWFLT